MYQAQNNPFDYCLPPNGSNDLVVPELSTAGDCHYLDLQPHEDAQVESCEREVIPPSDRMPGRFDFEVTVAHSITNLYDYSPAKKILYVKKGVKFTVQYKIGFPPPNGSYVRALVRCAEPEDVRKFGPVHKCKKHVELEGGSHFLLSSDASYSHQGPHHVTEVNLDRMPARNGVYMCGYECTCYSTCFFGRGNAHSSSSLIIIFTLIANVVGKRSLIGTWSTCRGFQQNGDVLGRDFINLKCSANVKRQREAEEGKVDAPSLKKTCRASPSGSASSNSVHLDSCPSLHPALDESVPDEDGFYTFTWRLKDVAMYNTLRLIKKGYNMQ